MPVTSISRGSTATGRIAMRANYLLQVPLSILFILTSRRIHPAYRMTPARKLALGARMFWNARRIPTASSPKAHLAMALKILETPPEVAGDVVECGTWMGGSAANLSLVCRIAGRRLVVFDSFQGLPEEVEGDREAPHYAPGDYHGELAEVRENIRRHGCLEVCELVPGWLEETLPAYEGPVLLAYLDVDLEASLETGVRELWPKLLDCGHMFIDEYFGLGYCALFWSEWWWREHFDRPPPGLIGAGSGLPLGEYFIGPLDPSGDHPTQHPSGGAYTAKGFSAEWSFRREMSSR